MANLALQQQQQYTADPGPGNVDELKGKFTLEQFAKRAANSKRGQNDRLFETDDLAKLIALSEDFSNETKYIIDESRIETLFEATIEEDRGFAGFTRDTKLQVLPFLGQIVIWVNKATPGSQLDLRFDEVRNQTVEAILYSIHQSLTGPTGVTSVDASKRHFISIGVLGATIVLLAYMNKKKNIKTEKHYVILRDILRHVATVGVIVDITGGRRVYNYDMPVTENQARSRLACITLIAQAMESMGNTDTGTKTMRLESIGDFLDVATAIFHLHKFAKDVSIDIVDMIGKIISREYAREPKGFSNELMRLLSSMETLGRSDQDRNMKMRVLGFTVAVNQHWDREAYVHSKEQQEQE